MVGDEDDDECESVGGMRIGKGNQSDRREPAPAPLCPPQIPHDLTLARTRAANRLSYGAANCDAKFSLHLKYFWSRH
jgi:hypothetical protein